MKITIDISPTELSELAPDSRLREQVLYQIGKAFDREEARITREGKRIEQAALRLHQERRELDTIYKMVLEEAPEYVRPRRLGFKQVQQQLATLNIRITRRPATGEYRVCRWDDTEAQAYYTNDLEDALNTGIRMAKEAAR